MVRSSCFALFVALVTGLIAPALAHAQSNGVPPLDGAWSGKLTDHYWDQTSAGSVDPKQNFHSRVDVEVDQDADEIVLVINFDDDFPIGAASVGMITLEGFAGNYHVSAASSGAVTAALSGSSNKKGTRLTLKGVIASPDFTHEVTIKLKKQNN